MTVCISGQARQVVARTAGDRRVCCVTANHCISPQRRILELDVSAIQQGSCVGIATVARSRRPTNPTNLSSGAAVTAQNAVVGQRGVHNAACTLTPDTAAHRIRSRAAAAAIAGRDSEGRTCSTVTTLASFGLIERNRGRMDRNGIAAPDGAPGFASCPTNSRDSVC